MQRLLRETKALAKRLDLEGPQNDDELHAWVIRNIGVDIPRTKVCEDHDPPFNFLADLYFERVGSAILIANRGGSKTFMVAILHLLNSKYKPGCESGTIGAIENQAKRAYAHFMKFTRDDSGDIIPDISQLKITETYFRNGSKLEILPGTLNSVNGPHWQKVHFDEVELADPQVYQESRNISTSRKLADGRVIKAQDIITSTRKYAKGLMQEILDEVDDAIHEGKKPAFAPYRWCIFETAAEASNCQQANSDLPKCDCDGDCIDTSHACQCDRITSGRWDEGGKTRTLAEVCKGRFAKSGGWQPFEDVVNTFTQSDKGMWEAQQECSRPSTENLYCPNFAKELHGIKNYQPDPSFGPIYMGIDWGGTNPHAVCWFQVLNYEIEATGHVGNKVRMKEGSVVCFNEIYIAEISNAQLADRIVSTETSYRNKWMKWKATDRFADPQGKLARLDFTRHNPPLKTTWHTTREFEEHVKLIRELFDHDRFYVDTDKCHMFCEEILVWRVNPRTGNQVDEFNHAMSAFRYAISNIAMLEKFNSRTRSIPYAAERPKSRRDYSQTPSVPASISSHPESVEPEEWQQRFVTTHGDI